MRFQVRKKSLTHQPTFVYSAIATVIAFIIGSAFMVDLSAGAAAAARDAIRINVGGPSITDAMGNVWTSDSSQCNGTSYVAEGRVIKNTDEQALFRSKQFGLTSCAIPAPKGLWRVRLLFTETYFNEPGKRVFSVKAERQTVARHLDVFLSAQGKDNAHELTRNITVTDGTLDLKFTPRTNQAILSGIELIPLTNSGNQVTTTTSPQSSTTAVATTLPTTTGPTTVPMTAPTTTMATTLPSTAPTTTKATTTTTKPTTTTVATTVPTTTTVPVTTVPPTTVPVGSSSTFTGKVSWQWQLSGTVDTTVAADIFDIDLFDTSDAVINTLKSKNKTLVCYFSAGTWEPGRPDSNAIPSSVIGSTVSGWPDEKWLDIRQLSVLRPIMAQRLDLCKARGFHAAEPDNVDGYSNSSGFSLSSADQIAYNKMLASLAHERGLKIALKNDLDQVAALEPFFDFAVNEQCLAYSECSMLKPFVNAGKSVLHVEYSGSFPGMCTNSTTTGFSTLKKSLSLGASRQTC